MVDRRISVALTVDGTDAQRGYAQAAQFAQQFGASTAAALGQATQATTTYTASVNQTTLAHQAQETAAQRFLSALERENTMIGKTRDQQLELRAAMLGVSQAADPLINKWREVTAAAQAASAAEKQAADGAAFVASLNSRANAIGKTSSQLLEMKAAELGVSAQAAPFIARLKESEVGLTRVGASAGQTAQAMRMLPAQLTDVVTSLQGGQNPFTVLLQQGGQTKDMFGGFGAMFAGIGAALTPLVLTIGAAAVAVGALGYAFVTGTQASDAMRTAVIATGQSAGLSAGQMQDLAGQVGKATGEFGTARDAAQQLAATGRLSGSQIKVALAGVVNGTKVTGQAVSDLVGDFVKLGDAPSKAIVDLNEKYHFLTATTYEQIAALEQQGRTTEAAALAQQTYADTLNNRSAQIVENIGLFARAWRMAKKDAGEAWDAFLNIGRPKTLAEEISEGIDAVDKFQKSYAAAKQMGNAVLAGEQLTRLNTARVDLLAKQEKSATEYTENRTKAESALAEQRAIEGQRRLGQLDLEMNKSKALSAALQKNKADEAAIREKNPNSDLITPAAIASREAETRKKYEDKSIGAAGQNAINGQIAALRVQQQAEESALKASLDEQKKLRDTSVTDLQQFYDNQYTLRASSLERQLAIAQKEVTAASGKNELAAREQAKGRVAKIQQEIEQNEAQHSINVKGIRAQYAESLGKQVGQWEEQKRAAADALGAENALYGKTDAQRRIATAGLKIEAEARKFRNAQADAGIAVTEAEAKAFDEKTAAQRRSAEQAEADMQAASGAQALYDQNRQFAADAIIDERSHAEALIDIERQKWQALIDAATEGSEQKKKLTQGLATWEQNQAARPQIEAQKAAYKNMIGGWAETIDGIGDVFREGFAGMLNGGKGTWDSFTKSLSTTFKTGVADVIYKMLAKPFFVQVIAGLAGAVTGNSSVAADITKAAGGDSSIFGNAPLSSLAKYFGGSSAAPTAAASLPGPSGYGIVTAPDAFTPVASQAPWASGIGSYFTNAPAASTFSLGGAGAGTAAGAGAMGIAGVLGGIGGGALFGNKGYSSIGGSLGATAGMAMATSAAAGTTALGAQLGMAAGPIGAIAGMVVGAALGSLMGEKSKPGVGNYGLADITSTGSVAASNDAMFFGDRRGFQGQSAGLTTGLTGLGDQIAAAAKLYGGDASGLRLYAQTAYSPDGKGASGGTALYGKNGQQVFGSAFEGTNEEMAANLQLTIQRSLLAGLKESDLAPQFANVLKNTVDLGTATADEISQISAALEQVRTLHAAFDGMTATFPKLAALGWEAREGLVAAAGGLDALQGNLNTYYGAFYSEAERTTNSLAQMSAAAGQLGVKLPDTREGFRSLVEAQDLATAAGQRTYASLIAMSGQFDSWVTASQAASKALQDEADAAAATHQKVVDTMKSAYADFLVSLQGDIDSARGDVQEAYNRETSALEATISATKSYIKSLADLRSSLLLGDLSTLSPEQKYAQGRSDLDALIAKADGGDAEAQAAVPQAIQQFLELSRGYNASTEAYQRDFAQYLDTAERMRTTAASQLDIQQSQLSRLAEMVAGVLTVNTSVLSLKDALASFAAAAAAKAAAPATAPGTPGGLSAIEQAVNAAYLASDGRNADAGGLKFWSDAIANGADQAAILAEIAAINSATKYSGAYADGGYAAAGLALVGERGPEVVDFRSPGRVYTSNELARVVGGGSGGNAEVVAELRATRQELAEQRRENARLMSTLINLTSATSQQSSREMAEQTTALRNRNSTLIPA